MMQRLLVTRLSLGRGSGDRGVKPCLDIIFELAAQKVSKMVQMVAPRVLNVLQHWT